MSCHRYFYPLILLLLSCVASPKRSEFEKGLDLYSEGEFYYASLYFNSYYRKNPQSDTTLYYLYDCYKRLNQPDKEIQILEQLKKIDSDDENVYLNLFYYYRKNAQYKDLYKLLLELQPSVKDRVDGQHALTRGLYAEIISGASRKFFRKMDPIVYATSQGYFPIFPDGKLYAGDLITKANLIILLDLLVDPIYPKKFFKAKNIPNNSFLYLPYMRLIELGILEFDPDLDPADNAKISVAVSAIVNLKKQGLIEP